MKIDKLNINSLIGNYGFWMAVLLSSLVIINLSIFYLVDNIAHTGMSALAWFAVFSLLWERRKQLKFQQKLLPVLLGVLLIAINLWFSRSIPDEKESDILSVAPFIFSVGVALVASGFYGLKQFKNELLIVFFVGVPRVILDPFTSISVFTAKFSSFLLHYLGFPTTSEGVYIYLPNGGVKVYEGCSGIESMTYVLGLSVICLIMFPVRKNHRFYVPIVGLVIGFLVNAFRVVLMAILVNKGNQESFNYWHEGEGSLIFGMIAVILFAIFYSQLMNKTGNNQSHRTQKSVIEHENFFN